MAALSLGSLRASAMEPPCESVSVGAYAILPSSGSTDSSEGSQHRPVPLVLRQCEGEEAVVVCEESRSTEAASSAIEKAGASTESSGCASGGHPAAAAAAAAAAASVPPACASASASGTAGLACAGPGQCSGKAGPTKTLASRMLAEKPPVFRSWKERSAGGASRTPKGARASGMGGAEPAGSTGGVLDILANQDQGRTDSAWAIDPGEGEVEGSAEKSKDTKSKLKGNFMKALRSITHPDGRKKGGADESRRTMSDGGSGLFDDLAGRPISPDAVPLAAQLAARGRSRSITQGSARSPLQREGSLKQNQPSAAAGRTLTAITRSASHEQGSFQLPDPSDSDRTWSQAGDHSAPELCRTLTPPASVSTPIATPPQPLTPPGQLHHLLPTAHKSARATSPLPPLPSATSSSMTRAAEELRPRPCSAEPVRPSDPGKGQALASRQQLSTEERILLFQLEKKSKEGRVKKKGHNGRSGAQGAGDVGSDTSSEDGDTVADLSAGRSRSSQRRSHKGGSERHQLSEQELLEMVDKIDEKLRKLRHKRSHYVEKLQRIATRKERVAGPIQQWLKPSSSN